MAILWVTTSFSFKCLAGKVKTTNNPYHHLIARAPQSSVQKLLKLKEMYVEWIQKTITRYNLDKSRVFEYNKSIKEFLAKVNES